MDYISTRSTAPGVSAAKAILQGLSPEGGLYVPAAIPHWTAEDLQAMVAMDYCRRGEKVLGAFLTDYTAQELAQMVQAAYGGGKFAAASPAPVKKGPKGEYLLELWHGPTCAFKDMALQLLPHLMGKAIEKVGDGKQVLILVATSGDTGKAALEGFRDVPGVGMLVFYPEKGVSRIQQLQMATQEGANVGVSAVQGNFDDCQSGVKKLFSNGALQRELEEAGWVFSSANSINWGRLVPQIIYYFSAYLDLVKAGELQLGERLNVAVPTGNFGNILAAYYAKQMGLPLGKLICASNENNVLTDFMHSGSYNKNRPFHLTQSPSMDILISSNLERLLFELCERDSAQVAQWMQALATQGEYTVTPEQKATLDADFWGGYCTDEQGAREMKSQAEAGYVCDTHTAVALRVGREYQEATGDSAKLLVVSTASPHKFAQSVLDALGHPQGEDEFATLAQLAQVSGLPIPPQLQALQQKAVRFSGVIAPEDMIDCVRTTVKQK